jgi:shikimate kinase
VIHLIGPGAAGKATVATRLAEMVGCPCFDLDARFTAHHGNIDRFIQHRGYASYATANVTAYAELDPDDPGVIALSSGFMTYPDASHPQYGSIRQSIIMNASTFVLLPSLDLETCVAETVRRQLQRVGLTRRSPAGAEAVIRARFSLYMAIPARHVVTMRGTDEIAAELASQLLRGGHLDRE